MKYVFAKFIHIDTHIHTYIYTVHTRNEQITVRICAVSLTRISILCMSVVLKASVLLERLSTRLR